MEPVFRFRPAEERAVHFCLNDFLSDAFPALQERLFYLFESAVNTVFSK